MLSRVASRGKNYAMEVTLQVEIQSLRNLGERPYYIAIYLQ